MTRHFLAEKLKNSIYIIILSLGGFGPLAGQGISVGPGLDYGFGFENPALHLRSYAFLNEHLCFGPEFNYFLPKTTTVGGEEERENLWEINLNAHYVFELSHKVGAYPIAGFNYSRESVLELHHSEAEPKIESAFGVNIGVGAHYSLGRLIPFVEYLYLASELGQHSAVIGTFIILWEKEHEEKHSSPIED